MSILVLPFSSLPLNRLLLFFFVVNLPICHAADGVMFNLGAGMNDLLIQSKSTSNAKQISTGLFWKTDFDFKKSFFKYDELEMEIYFSHITKNQQTINLIALRPVFSFWQQQNNNRGWFWQIGVGVSYFDNKNFLPIKLSSKAQFATMLAVGLPLDKSAKHRLRLTYNHYSNAYIKKPNPGLDTLSIDWHWSFGN